ncbi:hypothetical protein M8C21_032234 [Ambrosia artemisiifolia]|uniref:Uncharacterized protein n=1 Tax=Ambrosia artemisiifolia TaxID=4212 RepID=A0AAD5BYT5_AMBAR|nr:hypothetical protein M8C21_032234 [Ambrosia artemisiifolia]
MKAEPKLYFRQSAQGEQNAVVGVVAGSLCSGGVRRNFLRKTAASVALTRFPEIERRPWDRDPLPIMQPDSVDDLLRTFGGRRPK